MCFRPSRDRGLARAGNIGGLKREERRARACHDGAHNGTETAHCITSLLVWCKDVLQPSLHGVWFHCVFAKKVLLGVLFGLLVYSNLFTSKLTPSDSRIVSIARQLINVSSS